jgi:hypothetical protein
VKSYPLAVSSARSVCRSVAPKLRASPLLTVYNARGQGQILREQAESVAFQSELHYSARVDFDNVEFRFPQRSRLLRHAASFLASVAEREIVH